MRAGGAGKRTVNVEVRKKRTYVKREDAEGVEPEADATADAAQEVADQVATPEPVLAEVAGATDTASDSDDPELLRQRAASRRKAEEQARQLVLVAAGLAKAEEAARQAEEGHRRPVRTGSVSSLSVCMPRRQRMKPPRLRDELRAMVKVA